MELEHYKDEIGLDKMQITDELENPILDNLIPKLYVTFKRIGIDTSRKRIFYKRNNQGKSVLGIQIDEDNELSSYLLFDCSVEGKNFDLFCNVDFHANWKITDQASKLICLMSGEIIDCFENLEYEFNSNPMTPEEYEYMKSITKKKDNILSKIFGKKKQI